MVVFLGAFIGAACGGALRAWFFVAGRFAGELGCCVRVGVVRRCSVLDRAVVDSFSAVTRGVDATGTGAGAGCGARWALDAELVATGSGFGWTFGAEVVADGCGSGARAGAVAPDGYGSGSGFTAA